MRQRFRWTDMRGVRAGEGEVQRRRGGGRRENENLKDNLCACAHMWTHLKDSTTLFAFRLN